MDISDPGRERVNLSLGEFRALVAKAFRGAGYSWGLTEDASFAAMRLAEHGVDAGPVVVGLLKATAPIALADLMPTRNWEPTAGVLCPVCVGTAIADRGGCGDLSFEQIAEPVLLAPFLVEVLRGAPGATEASETADTSRGYVVSWDGGGCEVTAETIVVTGLVRPDVGPVTIASQAVRSAPGPRQSRVDLDDATKQALEAFAHRTYAPATEASRIAGAGAGLTDDD